MARARAAELGISLAEYMRRLVDQDLTGFSRKAHPSIVFDLCTSEGDSDIASDKDRMIAEATWASKSGGAVDP